MSNRNVIWIFGDQHRSQALGMHGDPNLFTPNLDNLARGGVDFPNALMGTPLCCPCRGSLLTSRYPHECVPGHEYPLPPNMPTLSHVFKGNGYETAWFGKWHLDGFREREQRAAFHTVPPDRRCGFDTWLGYDNNNSQYDCWVHGHDRTGREIERYRLPGYETESLTDLLIDFVRGKAGESASPFFAVLSVQPPHNPYVAPPEFAVRHNPALVKLRPNVPAIPAVEMRARKALAGYYAMIENLDGQVGRIRDVLREVGLDETTTIMFFSDHGDLHGSHGQFLKTSPLEESIRVPFIIGGGVSYYNGQHSGSNPALVNHVDVAPTTLGLCGINPPDWMRGRDLSGFFRADRPRPERPDSAFLQSVIPTGHGDSVDRPWRGIVTDDGWKFVCLEGQPWLMFDLKEDPYELQNFAFNPNYQVKRKSLLDRLRRWIEETGDSFNLPEL